MFKIRAWGALLSVAWLVFLPSAANAQSASVPQDGWWNLVSGPLTFIPGGFALPAPPPTTVPDDAIAAGWNGTERDKIAAMFVQLDAPLGSTVRTLKLSLKESTGTGANVGADAAKVIACPATSAWSRVHNGAWLDAPTYECDFASASGVRTADGTWTFDLMPLGAQWYHEETPLQQNGVVIVVQTGTQPVQVSFLDITTGDFRLEFAASPPSEPKKVERTVSGNLPAPKVAAPVAAPAATAAPEPAAKPPTAVLNTQPAQAQREVIGKPDVLGNLSWAVVLLVPLVVGVAGVTSYVLGPAGEPVLEQRQRRGAVSRALAAAHGEPTGKPTVPAGPREGAVTRTLARER